MIYRFGAFELDEEAGELRCAGNSISVQPKPLALLFLLVRERSRIVSQDEIFEALWPGTAVTSGSLTRAVSHARRALEDPTTQRGDQKTSLLRSFPRRGYRFVGEVTEIAGRAAAPAEPGAQRPTSSDANTSAINAFVGREDPLARLAQAWQEAQANSGRMVLIAGPPGVGKTRLADEFAAVQQQSGALVLVGRSRDAEGVPAFWIWAQVLRGLSEAGLASTDGGLEGLLVEAAKSADSEQRFLLFDAVARTLTEASRKRPVLLILEDLQWARSSSLRLLEHLSFELGASRLLVIATIRNETRERGHPVERTLAVLGAQPQFEQIELVGLSRAAVGTLLTQVIGRPAPTELVSELFALTEGVPLFVREAVRLLDERGDLKRPENIRRRGISLPKHAIDLIRRSFDGLSTDCARLAAAGAVLGREFTLGNVAHIAEVDRDRALDLLQEAVVAGALEEAPDATATYRFTHALFQDAAYDALQTGLRSRFHARACARLEQQHAEAPGSVIAELAHHHHQSVAVGNPERAFECAIEAAEEADRLLAFEQAATHYEQAIDALSHFDEIDSMKSLRTLIALGEAHRRAGDRKRRREVSMKAMQTARALGRDRDFALAAIRFCDVTEWSPADREAEAAIEEARMRNGDKDVVLRARLTARQAYLGIRNPNASTLAREAAELARASGDPEAIQEALYVLLYSLAGPDHLEERRELGRELAAAAREVANPDSAILALLDVASDFVTLGDHEQAVRIREEVAKLSGERPSHGMAWHSNVFDAGIALLEGRLAGIELKLMDALLMGRRIAHPYARACFNGQQMLLHRYRREYDQIRPLFENAVHSTLGPNHWARAVLARTELQTGNDDEAHRLWEALARSDFSDIARGIRWIGTLIEIAHLCADLEDSARAKTLIPMLASAEHLHGVLPLPILYGGPATYALARLNEIQGLADVAIEYYEAAIEGAKRIHARPMLARIQIDMAAPVLRSGDRPRSEALLADGQRLADEIGCHL